jgi:hypothetical protein
MSAISSRPSRREPAQRTAPVTTAATRSVRSGAKNRSGRSSTRRRQRVFTGRVLLIGLGIATAWGLFLWLFIGGAIASFGNPWLYS